jgi:hypothetical protein
VTEFQDRDWPIEAIRDRFLIEDLYDRQLAAAETHDWESYDTTFSADAWVDLSDFGEPERRYPEYRDWLEAVAQQMPKALRLTGGIRLDLAGDHAQTRVPVICCVKMRTAGGEDWTWTALFYNDELARTAQGWRIVKRCEELVYPDGSESPVPGSG